MDASTTIYLDRVDTELLTEASDSTCDEEMIIEKAKELDSDTWSELYHRYYPRIYGYLYRKLEDTHTAEDIAADVFLRAVDGIKSFKYRGAPLIVWLFKIAHNRTVDYFLSRAKVKTQSLTEQTLAQDALAQCMSEESFDRESLRAALKVITNEQRQVILLKFFSGLTNAEVGMVMNKPESAIKSLQHRGLASLKRSLEAEDRIGQEV